MRKHKYRTWDTRIKRMEFFTLDENFDCERGAFCKEVILMQFTGLFDKSGKGIYEGDIVQNGEYWTREVKWDTIDDLEMGDAIGVGYDDCFESGEVIGNTMENPELVEKINAG